ncbi:hypothetical protein C8R46DRAFT_1040918 [Mycena filopes]|nr:hypothetical protein C8R46DRAFT_1040918 [Mycena filopes]
MEAAEHLPTIQAGHVCEGIIAGVHKAKSSPEDGPPRSTGPPVASTSSHRGSHINPGYMGRGAMPPAPMQGQAFSGPPGHGNAPPYAPGGHGQYAPQAPPGGHKFHGGGPGAPPQGPQYAPGGHGQYGSQPPPGGHQFQGGGPGAPQYAPGYGAPAYTAYGGHGPPPTMHPPHQDWSGGQDPRNDADEILREARRRRRDSQDPKTQSPAVAMKYHPLVLVMMSWLWPEAKKPRLFGFGTKAKPEPKSWPGLAFGLAWDLSRPKPKITPFPC